MGSLSLLIVGWLALLAGPAGESPPAAPPVEPGVTFFSTATVEARPLDSSSSSATVIDRETIEASGAESVDELLAYVAGLTVLGDRSRGALNAAQIRGGDPNMSLVLIDGVAVNDATDQVGGAFNLASLPTAGVERIEIVRGPLSAVYGSTGLAGAVQVFTASGAAGAPRATVELAAGDASLFQASASLGGAPGAGDWFLNAGWNEEAGRLADDRFAGWNVYGNFGLAGAGVRLTTRLAAWDGDDYPEGSGGPRSGSGELRRSRHREASLGAVWERRVSPRLGSRLRLTWYRHELERTSPAIPPLVPPATESTRFERARLAWVASWSSDEARLAAGVDLDREEGVNRSVLFLPPFLGGAVAGDYDAGRTTPGAFAELAWERGRVAVELGLRADATQDQGTRASPRAGVSYRPGGGATRLHASLGRSYKLPSFFARRSPPALGGNPDLRPETLLGADLGLEHRFGAGAASGLVLDATLFANRFRDLIDFDFQSFLHVNRSEVEARGGELKATWNGGETVRLTAAVTWQEVTDAATGRPLRHRPRWSGSARVFWRPHERLTLELDARGLSASLDEEIPVPERTTVAGHHLFGAAAVWRFGDAWRLRLRVDNLADEDYETLIGYPGPERTFRLGLRYSH